MYTLAAIALGCVLDLIFGDPRSFPHPVVLIGKLISALEALLRRVFPKTGSGERLAGSVLAVLVPAAAFGAAFLVLYLGGLVHPLVRCALESIICWQCLAARSLKTESMKVYSALRDGDLVTARREVSYIVGRDTDALDAGGVARATVETVAENTSDGVTAPLIFMMLGGAPLGLMYKAINTMDSMVGYKNERYRHFGTVAARLDDLANFIPARLSGLLMSAAAFFAGYDAKNALRIFLRDRKNHKSPNSAHTEAACAGALGLRLGGGAVYFGEFVEKPFIGDDIRPITPEDIPAAIRLMLTTAALCFVLCAVLRAATVLIF